MTKSERARFDELRGEVYRLKVLATDLSREIADTLYERKRYGTYNMPGLRGAMTVVRRYRRQHGSFKPSFGEGRFL